MCYFDRIAEKLSLILTSLEAKVTKTAIFSVSDVVAHYSFTFADRTSRHFKKFKPKIIHVWLAK